MYDPLNIRPSIFFLNFSYTLFFWDNSSIKSFIKYWRPNFGDRTYFKINLLSTAAIFLSALRSAIQGVVTLLRVSFENWISTNTKFRKRIRENVLIWCEVKTANRKSAKKTKIGAKWWQFVLFSSDKLNSYFMHSLSHASLFRPNDSLRADLITDSQADAELSTSLWKLMRRYTYLNGLLLSDWKR